MALRWLIENPVVLPIPGAKNGKQATANAGALTFSLTSEEVDALNEATRRLEDMIEVGASQPGDELPQACLIPMIRS